jgi:hypothetical protein
MLPQQEADSMTRNREMAIQSGVRDWPYPREFNRMFPHAINGISYYTGGIGESKWYSKIGLYGRYVLIMAVPIKLDDARTNIVFMGNPEIISLGEVLGSKLNANGSRSYSVNRIALLSSNDWRRLTEANGNFDVLNIKIETNKPPVEGFNEAWPSFSIF